jgi:hypothetical protein
MKFSAPSSSCSIVFRVHDNCIVLVTSPLERSQLVSLFTSVRLTSSLITVSLSVRVTLSGLNLIRIPLR